jgi:hypothetical protein
MKTVTPKKIDSKGIGSVIFGNILVCFLTLSVGLVAGEVMLRVKNLDQKNYNIEMWRYAKLLKQRSSDPVLGHEHRPETSARLQGVEVRINQLGMRGPEVDLNKSKTKKRILFLGTSNTLGWGVEEADTLCAQVQNKLGQEAQVFNAGIGNYNAERYVRFYEKGLRYIKPDVVVINFFIRDAEILEPGGGNFFLRHSQLAATFHQFINTFSFGFKDPSRLIDYYRNMYSPEHEGFQAMSEAFARLNNLAKEDGFKVVFTVIPDVHAIAPYPFGFIHERMRTLALSYGWDFIDFQDVLGEMPQKDLWVMPGDPHMNALGQEKMAIYLLPHLS